MTPHQLQKLVILSLAILLALLLLLDAWLIAAHGDESSISATVHQLARDYPAIPFAAGLIVAHLFRF